MDKKLFFIQSISVLLLSCFSRAHYPHYERGFQYTIPFPLSIIPGHISLSNNYRSRILSHNGKSIFSCPSIVMGGSGWYQEDIGDKNTIADYKTHLAAPRSWKSSAAVPVQMPGRPMAPDPHWRRRWHSRHYSSSTPESHGHASKPSRQDRPWNCLCVSGVEAALSAVAVASPQEFHCPAPSGHWWTCDNSSDVSPRCPNRCDPTHGVTCGLPVEEEGI